MSDSAAHTPGPWLDWETMEWVKEPDWLLTNTEDARLIAAAPEMLEALTEISKVVGAATTLDRDQVKLVRAFVRAAIAKATGAAR